MEVYEPMALAGERCIPGPIVNSAPCDQFKDAATRVDEAPQRLDGGVLEREGAKRVQRAAASAPRIPPSKSAKCC
jgi:hypothetical protein